MVPEFALFLSNVSNRLLFSLDVFRSFQTNELDVSTATTTAKFGGTSDDSSSEDAIDATFAARDGNQPKRIQIEKVAGQILLDRNPVSSLQCASVVPRLLEGFWRLLERLALVDLVQSEMERLLGGIPSYQPCKDEAECLKATSSLRIRVVEPVLGLIIARLAAEEQASKSSTMTRWGVGKFSLISKSPRLHRHQQGDEDLLLLADRKVASVVCLESKQDSVLNKYGRTCRPRGHKIACQEAGNIQFERHLLKSGLQLATASIDYRLNARFGIVCGAYLGFVTEKVRLPESHKGDFGVLFSPIFQSLPITSFETQYPTVSLAMVLLALCLSAVLEVEAPSPDVVAALFKDAQFEAEDDITDSSFRSSSDTEGSLYMDTEAPSSDSN